MLECDRLFRLCPHVPFAVEPTTHAHIIQTFVCNVLETVCPLTATAKKRRAYLSEHTHHLVRQSIGVRRGLLKAWTSIRYSGVFVAFGSWRKLAQGRLSGVVLSCGRPVGPVLVVRMSYVLPMQKSGSREIML